MVRIRKKAYRLRTEPPKPISSDHVIQPIEHSPRHQSQHPEKRPWKAQVRKHPDRASGFEPGASILEKNIGLELDRIQAQMPIDGLAQWSLRGHQTENGTPVIPQDELGESRAEDAVAVKDDDRAVIRKVGYGGVFPVAESLAWIAFLWVLHCRSMLLGPGISHGSVGLCSGLVHVFAEPGEGGTGVPISTVLKSDRSRHSQSASADNAQHVAAVAYCVTVVMVFRDVYFIAPVYML